MRIGYSRVSTTGQSLETQLEKLESCDKVFSEKLSGAKMRPELETALDYLREGDSLVVTKLDRLARSITDLHKIMGMLEEKGANLEVLDQKIDTSTPTGKLTFSILGAIAEFERELINERVEEGRKKAKANGVKFGAKRRITDEQRKQIVKLVDANSISKKEIGEMFDISRQAVYKIYREETSN